MVGFQPPATQTRSQAMVSGLPSTPSPVRLSGRTSHRADPPMALAAGDRIAGPHGDPAGFGPVRQAALQLRAQIDHRDRGAGGAQIERGPIRAVVVGEHHRLTAGAHRVLIEIAAHGARQHDARPIVLGEHQRSLQRAGRQHDLAGAQLP